MKVTRVEVVFEGLDPLAASIGDRLF